MKPSRSLLIGSAVVSLMAVLAYAGVLQNEFVEFDDNIYITQNPVTKSGLSIAGWKYAWSTFDSGNWIPLTWLSYQFDATLFGIRPAAFHAVNLFLHAVNSALLFVWLVRVTRSGGPSFVVALLFAVHPLHVESIAWAAERKDLLCLFWLLAALFAYERFANRQNAGWYVVTLVAFALGLLSKSMLVTFPLLLCLVDIWPLNRLTFDQAAKPNPIDSIPNDSYPQLALTRLLLEKVPFLLLSVVDGLITISAQDTGMAETSAFTSLSRLPIPIRLGNSLNGYGWYLQKTFAPIGLSIYYPHPLDQLDWSRVALCGLVLALISVYVAIRGLHQRALWFGWLWFLVALLPVIGLLQVGSQAYADRYSYIPHIGLFVLIVWEAAFWCERILDRRAVSLAVGIIACALMWLTTSQVQVWRTTETLWNQALVVDPDNWFAHLQLGNFRLQHGQIDDQSLRHFDVVLQHQPQHVIALYNVGWVHEVREDWAQAERFYRKTLTVDPRFTLAIHNLVTVLKKQARLVEAAEMMQAYAEKRPDDGRIQKELGLLHARQGRMEQARDCFARAVRIAPNDVGARNNLALALSQLGQDTEAVDQLEQALALQPTDVNAHVNLGVLLKKSGQLMRARDHFATAIRLNPGDNEAREHLDDVDRRLKAR